METDFGHVGALCQKTMKEVEKHDDDEFAKKNEKNGCKEFNFI